MKEFDLCVIGAGPAGFAACMRAVDFGKRVALVERGPLGGAGVHNGALSSKTFWELSRDYRRALEHQRGYRCTGVELDYGDVVKCISTAVEDKVNQLREQIAAFAPDDKHPTRGSITLIRGSARFASAQEITVEGPDGKHELRAPNFVIATGSRPRLIDSIKVDGKFIMTSDHIMSLRDFPQSLVILGAGVVGCEFATIFANYGRTKVHLIDRADRILPFEDEDIAGICSRNLQARGVTVHHSAKLLSMVVQDEKVHYTIEYPDKRTETIVVERALLSIGRVSNVQDLGLEKAGVELTERGDIVNIGTQTTAPHIYACGDVTSDIALVNVGEVEGRHAVERLYGKPQEKLSYEELSTIMFLDPEVAAVGLNELQAKEKKIPYRVGVYSYGLVNRAIAMRSTGGVIKLLVSDDAEMRILGMRALGVHASTSIQAAALMVKHRRPISELADLLHPHPAITEALQECVRMLLGTSIYKPSTFRNLLRLEKVRFDEQGNETRQSLWTE